MLRFWFPKYVVAALAICLCAWGCSDDKTDPPTPEQSSKTSGEGTTSTSSSAAANSTPTASKANAAPTASKPNAAPTASKPNSKANAAPTASKPNTAPTPPTSKAAPKTTNTAAASPSKIDILNILSSKSTMGFVGVVGIPEMFQFLDAQIGQLLANIPAAALPEEAKAIVNKATRDAFIGFDVTTPTGWNSIGIDISGGLYLIFDNAVGQDGEPSPILAAKISDRKKLLAFLQSKGMPAITFSAKQGASELAAGGGEKFLIGQRGGFTFIQPKISSADGAVEQKAFNGFLQSQDPSLQAAGVASRALASGNGTTRFFGFANTAGFGQLIDASPADTKPVIRFIADRLPGAGFSTRTGGASFKLVARQDAVASMRKMFRPKTAPQMAQYVPRTGWAASRISINLDTLFQGVSEFIPPENFQAKMAVMSAPVVLAGVGLDWSLLSGALDGHMMLSVSIQGLTKLLQQKADFNGLMAVFGVRDEEKADRLLSSLVDMIKKQGASAPSMTPTTVAGRPGYVFQAGSVNPVLVRVGKAIFIATSAADVETAVQASKGSNLSNTEGGRILDEHNAFIAQSVDMNDYLTAAAGILNEMWDPGMKSAGAAINLALAKQKDTAVLSAAVRLEDGLELRIDGLDKVMPAVLSSLKELVPLLLK